MSNWSRIKERLYQDKIQEVNNIFEEISRSISNGAPRNKWFNKLELWTKDQITERKFNLEEYSVFSEICESLEDLTRSDSNQLQQIKDQFIKEYTEILQSKENDLKLEVAAEIIEEKDFPLDLFIEWFANNCDLNEKEFQEALGNFWGDVWRGAGVGAVAGGTLGALGTAGLGTWAGTGLGALGGGIYGAGKHLLHHVVQWKKNREEFENTKEEVVKSLNKLKAISQNFDFDQNFYKAIDTIIERLGTAKAYRVKPPEQPQVQPKPPEQTPQQPSQPKPPEQQPQTQPKPQAQVEKPLPQDLPPPPPEKPKLNFSTVSALIDSYKKVDDNIKLKLILGLYHQDMHEMSLEEIRQAFEKKTEFTPEDLDEDSRKTFLDLGNKMIDKLESTVLANKEAKSGVIPDTAGELPELTASLMMSKESDDLKRLLKKRGLDQYFGKGTEFPSVGGKFSSARQKLVDFILKLKAS